MWLSLLFVELPLASWPGLNLIWFLYYYGYTVFYLLHLHLCYWFSLYLTLCLTVWLLVLFFLQSSHEGGG